MPISYTADAFESLVDIVNYIESMNTLGAGLRWLNKFETFLVESLSSSARIKHCNNLTFNQLGLYCLNFNDWVVAFSTHHDKILIEAILHSSRLVD